jgi:hydrogenase maturation protease
MSEATPDSPPESHDADDRPVGAVASATELADRLESLLVPPVAVVCIGNDLCGDDGVGVEIAHRLTRAAIWRVYNAQTAPESFLMKIVTSKPASVLVIDALDFGAQPGDVSVTDAARLGGQGPSTHGPAPLAFLRSLAMMHTCRRALVGIQPRQTEVGQGLSAPVASAVGLVVAGLERLVRRLPGRRPATPVNHAERDRT